MKRNHRTLNLTVSTSNTRSEWGNQNYRPRRDISNFNYTSPTVVPPPSAIPTINSLDSDDSTSTLQQKHFTNTEKPLPPVSYTDDAESVYSQDSACVILPPTKKVADATPKTALTFAAIWDPDCGFTTISGSQLLSNNNNGTSIRGGGLDHNYDDDYGNGHPDCEPHLPSRFSVTTTSTSSYINVDFGSENNHEGWNWSWSVGKTGMKPSRSTTDYLRPGDLHPAWVPQIFNAGYTRPKTSRSSPKRPEISGPFQLTSSTALPTTLKTVQKPDHERFEYERPPPPPLPPSQPYAQPQSQPVLRRAPSEPQSHLGLLPRTLTSSPSTLKRAKLPSMFGKLKRSATMSNISSSSSSSSSLSLAAEYENSIRQGWVIVDVSKMKSGRVQ